MESRRLTNSVAFGWGLSEAVLFFVIPDVLLTYVAVRQGVRRGLEAAGWAAAGAVIGGLLAFAWGALDAGSVNQAMVALPAVDCEMLDTVTEQVEHHGPRALISGPLGGRPYKLYAAASGATGASPVALALWTIPGRLWRFVMLAWLSGSVTKLTTSRLTGLPPGTPVAAWAAVWILVYVAFWSR